MYLQRLIFLSHPQLLQNQETNLTVKKHIIAHQCQFSTECAAENPESLLNRIYKYAKLQILICLEEMNFVKKEVEMISFGSLDPFQR